MINKKAPGAVATASEGDDQTPTRGTIDMSIAEAKYQEYTCVTAADLSRPVFYENTDGRLVRFYCQILRIPSRKEFVVRFYAGADAEDRRRGELMLRRMPEGKWAEFPARTWFKRRHPDGHYYWKLTLGRPMEDPLVQLELEMMIDLEGTYEHGIRSLLERFAA